MRTAKNILGLVVLFVIALGFVSDVVAQAEFTAFLSDNDTFADMNTTLDSSVVGSSFDIWVKTSVLVAGISLDVEATGNAIQLANSTLLNPPSSGGNRWAIAQNGQPVAPNSIVSIDGGAFLGLSGAGIGPGTTGDDGEYDANIDAFKFATIDYDVVGEGTSELTLRIGGNIIGFADAANAPPIFLGIGDGPVQDAAGSTGMMIDGTITVVPEPHCGLLLGLGLITMMCARPRK